ncbi:fungal-specific transcription factor domain-containing protein [Trichoderma austrokoningii]
MKIDCSILEAPAMSAAANEVSNDGPALKSMAGNEENRNRAAVDEAALNTTPALTQRISSSLRRRACDACRARKVKCDTQDPPCNRCAKMGISCKFSGRAKPTNSKIGMSRFLETLNNRLKQAEAQLASTHSMQQNQLQFSMAWGDIDRSGLMTSSPPHITSSQEAQSQWNSVPAPTYPTYGLRGSDAITPTTSATETSALLPIDNFTYTNSADVMMAQNILDIQPFEFESMIFNTPSPTSEPMPNILDPTLQKLYKRYFDVFHPLIPIINRGRFELEISQSCPTLELQALSYAMAALTAFSVPELQNCAKFYHEQARNLIDLCERQEGGDSLGNINILQAYAIVTFYELRRPNFARAYLTLGRAIRLVQILGLDNKKSNSGMNARWGLSKQPSHSTSPAEQEEKRRVFWILFIFDSFASLRSNISPAFTGIINVSLPSSSEYPDFSDEKMPRQDQVFEPTKMSSFAANTFMISLYQRYFKHVESSYDETSQGFWETHYAIDKTIEHYRTTLLTPHMNGDCGKDPLAIGLRMNLNAIKINLHQTALFRVEKDQLPGNLAMDANSKCAFAVADTVKTVQAGMQLTGNRAVSFRQLSRFFVWPITTAIQVCFRMLYNGIGNSASYISFLRILSHAMKEIIDPEEIPLGLLESAQVKIADAARSIRRK